MHLACELSSFLLQRVARICLESQARHKKKNKNIYPFIPAPKLEHSIQALDLIFPGGSSDSIAPVNRETDKQIGIGDTSPQCRQAESQEHTDHMWTSLDTPMHTCWSSLCLPAFSKTRKAPLNCLTEQPSSLGFFMGPDTSVPTNSNTLQVSRPLSLSL